MTDCMNPGPGFELVDLDPTALDRSAPNPITIICGDEDHQIQFSAFPEDGTITTQYFGPEGGFTEFSVEEFGLITALLIGTADGDF